MAEGVEMPDLGPAEILLVLVVVLLVFGGSRVAELGGALGKGVREFRKTIAEEDEVAAAGGEVATAPGEQVADAAGGPACASCGTENVEGAKFCASCGGALT